MWLAWLCGSLVAVASTLSVVLTRRVSPSVTEEQTSAAPAVQTPASVAPEPVMAEPVGKTEIIVAHEDSLGGLAIRGGKIYYIDYPEFGRDNGSIKVASVDGTLQRGKVRLRGAMSGVVSDDRATCFFYRAMIQCDGGELGRFGAYGFPTAAVVRGNAIYWVTLALPWRAGALVERRNGKDLALAGGLVGASRLAVNSASAYVVMCQGNADDDCVIEAYDFEDRVRRIYDVSRGDVRAIAVDDHGLYWIDGRRGEIRGLNSAASEPWTVASHLKDARAIAIDKDHVYWTDHAAGTVTRARKSGGEVTLLAAHQKGPIDLALDGDHVYWSNRDDGTIRRTEKLPVQ
jgi:hypothetical protein